MRLRLFIYALCVGMAVLWGLDQYLEHDRLLKAQDHFFSYDDRPMFRYWQDTPSHAEMTTGTSADIINMDPQHIPETGELPNGLLYDEETMTITAPSFQTRNVPFLHIDDLSIFIKSNRSKIKGASGQQRAYICGILDATSILLGEIPEFYRESFGEPYKKK